MSGPTDFTTLALVKKVRRRAFLSSGQGLTDNQVLEYLTDELTTSMVGFLKRVREEYLVTSISLPVTSPIIPVPVRATGAALREVFWVLSPGQMSQLNRIEPEAQALYQQTGNQPSGYMFQGNNMVLLPGLSSGNIQIQYMQRPGQLVWPTDCGVITAINTGANQVTVASLPTSFTNSTPVDLVSHTPNFVASALDQTISVSGNVLTFTSLPSTLAVGDYVCLSGQTPVVQLPYECQDGLAAMAAATITKSIGSDRAEEVADSTANTLRDLTDLLTPRDDGSPKFVVARGFTGSGWWY